ncbi:hypothetical protein ACFQ2B_21385 [Streptomyces stramineus]
MMKCKAQKSSYTIGTITGGSEVSYCVWGDSSAVGVVQHLVTKSSGGISGATGATGNVMSAKDLSEATVKVRNEVRKEK